MNNDSIKKIAAELQKEFGVPVEISDSDTQSNRWAYYRLAAEYGDGKGKPKQLLNRAIKSELLGGEILMDLKVWLINRLKDDATPPHVRSVCKEVLAEIECIRDEMCEEILRRYANPAGQDAMLALFHKLDSFEDNETVQYIRSEMYTALQDMMS